MMWQGHDGMGWWMVFGGIIWLFVWGSVIWLIVSAVRPRERKEPAPDAMEVARRRYASGEITREAYQQLQRDLSRDPGGTGGA